MTGWKAGLAAAVIVLATGVGAGLVTHNRTETVASAPAHVELSAEQVRSRLFAELQPIALANCELRRFGEPHDGGYVMCANLLGAARAGYSYGISGYDQWGCDVSRRFDVAVHQYDCFDLDRPACPDGNTVFHEECVGPAAAEVAGRRFDTLERQMEKNGDGASRVVVKMDVEGAEWDTFLESPDAVLDRIDQLSVEFHGSGHERYLAAVLKLKRFFHVANLHFNNYSCQDGLAPFPSWAYEVLFVSRRLGVPAASGPAGGHRLDTPNDPGVNDCQVPLG
jgi:hypothetical protein